MPPTLTKEEHDCYLDLYTSVYEEHRARNPPRVSGTCQWILEHELYKSWFKAEASSLLWISADPGCGKLVMMSFLISHNKNQSLVEETNTCYFFFKTNSPEQREPTHALCAILHQIYTSQPILIKHAMAQVMKKGKNIRTLGTLWKIFIDTIED